MKKKHSQTRRNFLQQSAALAGAVSVFPSIVPQSVFGANAPSNRITMGFIGTGNNGTNYLKLFLKDERVRAIAVCDVNREGPGYWDGKIAGREPARRIVNDHYGNQDCAVYEDFRDVLARGDIDAVQISTPDHWHAYLAIAAAKAGKDIYGQKPLSLTVADGRAMVKAINRYGRIWQTGSQQRSDFNFRRVCELVRNGRIGKLHTVRCGLPGGIPDYGHTASQTNPEPVPDGFNYEMWLGPAPEAPYCPARCGVNFRWIYDYSGGQVTDWGGHHPDIAQWGMNTEKTGPVEIRNAHGEFPDGPLYNTAVKYHFECIYANGVKLIVSDEERHGVTFEGTEGSVWATRGRHDADPKSILDSEIGADEVHLYVSDDHTRNFIDCVQSRKEPIAPIETAHRSITLAHLGNIAMLLGRDLKWDPVNERVIDDDSANAMLTRAYRKPWVLPV